MDLMFIFTSRYNFILGDLILIEGQFPFDFLGKCEIERRETKIKRGTKYEWRAKDFVKKNLRPQFLKIIL